MLLVGVDDKTLISALKERGYTVVNNECVKTVQWQKLISGLELAKMPPEEIERQFKWEAMERMSAPIFAEAVKYTRIDEPEFDGIIMRATARLIP